MFETFAVILGDLSVPSANSLLCFIDLAFREQFEDRRLTLFLHWSGWYRNGCHDARPHQEADGPVVRRQRQPAAVHSNSAGTR